MKRNLYLWRYWVCLLFALLVCSSAHSQAVSQTDELTTLSLSISDKLQYLKQETASMSRQLEIVTSKLQMSEQEQKALKEQSMNLSQNLLAINEQLNECYDTILIQKQKLKTRLTIVVTLMIILIVRTACMVLGFILYAKGIKLPRWLDILL